MDLMVYWTWDNFQRDSHAEQGFHYNSTRPRLHSAIAPGEDLWLVTGRPSGRAGTEYVLLARLRVAERRLNAASYHYGQYRLVGDPERSADFAADGPDMTDLLLALEFHPRKPINRPLKDGSVIANSLRSMRQLSPHDSALLHAWTKRLRVVDRSFRRWSSNPIRRFSTAPSCPG